MSDAWNSFGEAGGRPQAVSETAIAQTELEPIWRAFFSAEKKTRDHASILDIGCGSGAVAEAAANTFGETGVVHCLDRSLSAVSAARQRVMGSVGIVSGADSTPYCNQSFDIVVSQYGAEYAGARAFAEAARLVAPGGVLCALAHIAGGAIHQECTRNADIAKALLTSNVFSASRAAFSLGDQLRAGTAPREALAAAQQGLQGAVKTLEAIIQTHGTEAAGGLPARLYNDLGRMFRRMTAYRTDELLSWCDQFEAETNAYAARMTSMQEAALDDAMMTIVENDVVAAGLIMTSSPQARVSGGDGLIAWRIEARRP